MIIFGTRGVKSTLKSGTFLCPQCAVEKPYKHIKVTKFFTLYFIPLIPLGSAGEYVECQTCKGTFVPRVLDYKPDTSKEDFQAVYEEAMKYCMVSMMLADGEIDENEMLSVQKIVNKFSHHDVTIDELVAFTETVKQKKEPIINYLSKVTPSLNEHGKEIIIKCGLLVATADGKIDPSEMKLIQEMAEVLEMSPSHVKGILHEMTEPTHSFSEN
ncbi:MAG: TerB family tellurite resistance protein [Saprospiraceae bacterium]|nr:TerB family tellurite resistance protein [Saprospiraceae bacterium]MBK8852334.1 TerB family tellurite resistance protein [Saprospiraceae bacterium]